MLNDCVGSKRISCNRWDNWYGYIGRNRVIAFVETPTQTQEQAANEWLASDTMTVMEEFGVMATHKPQEA